MTTIRRLAPLLALPLLFLAGRAQATPGTCTIEQGGMFIFARVPSAGNFRFQLNSVNGLAIPVDVDAATGAFTMMRGTLPLATFDTGIAGIVDVQLAGADAVGTLDAGGNASLPGFAVTLIFGGTPLPIAPTLSTAMQTRALNGIEFPIQGGTLDFQTGVLTLAGPDIIPTAPIVNEPTITEVHLACRLDPIPAQASLPAAPGAKANGKAKVSGAEQGDTLKLKAKLTPGAVPFDFAGSDLFVQISAADGTPLLVAVVNAGALGAKGKKFSARDTDGTVIEVTTGKKAAPAPVGGSITIVNGKKAKLTLSLVGVDLGGLGAGAAHVTVTVGPNVAPASVTVRGSGKKRTFR